MKILVTGAKGFIGKNLISVLKTFPNYIVYPYDVDSSVEELELYTKDCSFIFHLAGVNRPSDPKDFMTGNYGFTQTLLSFLKKNNNKAPIMLASSIQAELNNPYGESKKAGENLLIEYGKKNRSPILIYRFPNVFGKWCKPNYNSVVATFCYNIANHLPIQISDPNYLLNLIYIDDLVSSLISLLNLNDYEETFYSVTPVHQIKLGELANLIHDFKDSRQNRTIPSTIDPLTKKLYATYLSYLPENSFSYPLKMNIDQRGSFTEFIKTPDRGQVSINISKPGIVKGNHWHHTKNEKFLVVSGYGVIRFRNVLTDHVIEYRVSGEKLEVIDIPPGYTHNIENLGSTDMVTVMWANEYFNPDRPDTIFLEV
ncbi:MAG: capsular polysaccharide biosynthesis protein CapF [Acholeplasmataceae bacterium]|nr:capsular polysaccharide biosynthesis protein CapF [Acholeplasmataceae bacterium]